MSWMKRWVALAALAGALGCPPAIPDNACTANSDCNSDELCVAGNCIDGGGGEGEGEGEGNEGEGEGEAGEGEGEGEPGEGEGEGEAAVQRLEVDVVPALANYSGGGFTLRGGAVGTTSPLVLQGNRFTLRPAVVGVAP